MLKKEKIPVYFVILGIGYISILIFIENFVISSSFDILCLRTVDDVAFQSSLNAYYGKRGWDLLFMNDYGYGWIYWFPIYILTLPAHILQQATGVSWLLIVLPRMQSLFFAVMASVLCYKIISVYTHNVWIRAAVTFLMPLFPAGGYYAGRFGTVNQVAFFSMLASYLVVKEDVLDRKKLRMALSVFAIAMATKVSAVCMAPMFALLILNRFHYRFTIENIKLWVQEVALAVFLMFFLMSPAIVLAPLNRMNAKYSMQILIDRWTASQTGGDFAANLAGSMGVSIYQGITYALVLALLVLAAVGIKNRKKGSIRFLDFIVIPAGYITGVSYLAYSIGVGEIYVFMYSTAVSFVLPFGILALEYVHFSWDVLKKVMISGMAAVLCIVQCRFIYTQIQSAGPYNILRYFQEQQGNEEKIEQIHVLKENVEKLGIPQVYLYIDNISPTTFYNQQEQDNIGYLQVIWNNLGELFNDQINIIVLSKNNVGFSTQEEFENRIQDMEDAQKEKYRADRIAREKLVQSGECMGKKWSMVYEDQDNYMFVREDVL